jgi:hypothetical protein
MPHFRVRHCGDVVRMLVDAPVSALKNLYVPLTKHAWRAAASSVREVRHQRDDKEVGMLVVQNFFGAAHEKDILLRRRRLGVGRAMLTSVKMASEKWRNAHYHEIRD